MDTRSTLARSIRAALAAGMLAVVPSVHAAPEVMIAAASPAATMHQEGQRALDARDYAKAVAVYAELVKQGGSDVDAALYWKAYAEMKARRPLDAKRTLEQFFAKHAASRWAKDAQALKVDVEVALGEKPSVDTSAADEELKLYALDGLMQMDPKQALPILKKFMAGRHSPRLKERALFVASQSELPEAHQIVLDAARDNANPDLQRRAINILGVSDEPTMIKALLEIYRSGPENRIKRAVLDAWVAADAKDEVLAAARGEADPALRRHAANLLGAMDAVPELRALLQSEKDPGVRRGIIEGLMVADDAETMLLVARTEADAGLRRHAIHMLGAMDHGKGKIAGANLEQIYLGAKEPSDKRAVIEALHARDDAATLLKLFRAEKDPAMKRYLVQLLASMDAPEAEQLMMDILDK